MKKPTAFWYWNCEPTTALTHQQTPRNKVRRHEDMKKSPASGLCSEERSMISPDYARNFIADFILGRPLGGRPQQQDLFAQTERSS